MSFKNNTGLRLCVFIVCSLSLAYALLKAVIEKCLLNSCLFKLSKIFQKYLKIFIVTEVAGCRPLTLLKLTLSQTCLKNSAKINTLCFRECLINVQL